MKVATMSWINKPPAVTALLKTLLPCLVWLLPICTLHAATLNTQQVPSTFSVDFPQEYGEIVYQTDETAPANIYIIANAHRSAITGKNSAASLQAQLETFRIGEWLINRKQVELLLPEGFFGTLADTSPLRLSDNFLDTRVLQDSLSDTSVFTNAELLLHENYGIGLTQVEDRALYSQTRDRLHTSLAANTSLTAPVHRELAYLQKRRTATILQSVPAVVESARKQGTISAPNAMLTIGLSHLEDVIEFLKQGEISFSGLQTATRDYPPHNSNLELLERQLNVTVIVPRTLVKHRLTQRI